MSTRGKLISTTLALLIASLAHVAKGQDETTDASIGVTASTTTATELLPSVEDCKVLQEQLNVKALEIDGILKRLEGLEGLSSILQIQQLGLTKNLTDLTGTFDSALKSIAALNSSDVDLSKRLSIASTKLSRVNSSMAAVENNNHKLNNSVGSMTGSLNRMTSNVKHLNEITQIWRNNFRQVNTTFRNIRKKVNFPLPSLSLGRTKGDDPFGEGFLI